MWLLQSAVMHSSISADDFVAMLGAVDRLHLVVATEKQHTNISNAFEHATSCGLSLPREHSVSVME
jgi:hypothetical protein